MDNAAADANNCSPAFGQFSAVEDDIVRWAIYVDSNDIEGLRFVTEVNEQLIYKANYILSFPDPPA